MPAPEFRTRYQVSEATKAACGGYKNLPTRVVAEGFELALEGRIAKIRRFHRSSMQAEAKPIAMPLGDPPKGFGKYTVERDRDVLPGAAPIIGRTRVLANYCMPPQMAQRR